MFKIIGEIAIQRILQKIYGYLNVGRKPEGVDCIFVFAGRPERKQFALQLYEQGLAQQIVFSVGRFEWRRFLMLIAGQEQNEKFLELVSQTPPEKRHFFVCLKDNCIESELIEIQKYGTFTEAIALEKYIKSRNIKTLMLVSSAFHLRRATLIVKRQCSGTSTKIVPIAVPDKWDKNLQKQWWTNAETRSLIVSEYIKYLSYRFILPLTSDHQSA